MLFISIKSSDFLLKIGTFSYEGEFFKAIPHNGTRVFGERFCPKRKFRKPRNTVCISHIGGPIKGIALYGERRSPNTVGISRLREMKLCVWCFDDLHDWGKRSIETRSSHCAVLPFKDSPCFHPARAPVRFGRRRRERPDAWEAFPCPSPG